MGLIIITLLHFAAMRLTEPQKKFLRGLGHPLKPLVTIGEAGLSDAVLSEYESTLDHHELMKIRVRVGDRHHEEEVVMTQIAPRGRVERRRRGFAEEA